jgi:hypothetical protein
MNLIGQHLAFWMPGESLRQVYPRLAEHLTGIWMLWGKVKGETPGVGLWIEVRAMNKGLSSELALMPETTWATMLFRWERIIGATLADELPTDKHRIGFLP